MSDAVGRERERERWIKTVGERGKERGGERGGREREVDKNSGGVEREGRGRER